MTRKTEKKAKKIMKKAVKKEVKKSCGDYERGSDDAKACVSSVKSSAKSSFKSEHPKAAGMMKKVMEHHKVRKNAGDGSDM